MPFVFGVFGILFIVAGVRGQSANLFSLVKSDFSGSPNYFEWMTAIFAIGAIGYIKQLSTISRMFMGLILIGLLYQNKQAFSELAQETEQQPTQTSAGSQASSSGTSSSILSGVQSQPNQSNGTPGLPALPTIGSDFEL